MRWGTIAHKLLNASPYGIKIRFFRAFYREIGLFAPFSFIHTGQWAFWISIVTILRSGRGWLLLTVIYKCNVLSGTDKLFQSPVRVLAHLLSQFFYISGIFHDGLC